MELPRVEVNTIDDSPRLTLLSCICMTRCIHVYFL
ncbi:unnamed protein product [Spirodela intermedia]|uniref:Uncharacterized protein n=1 Tax=Spirodela intermedia TaxID=51605 RepID=A0A7I8IP93_SPIIN|nr:unnamed protein product [Spirodela intermedia]CAA6658820.1 unnamed protein product [Spirodela intermedia]